VVTREEMIAAINPKTLAIHFTNILSDKGQVNGPDTVAIAKEHNLYTFNDASADVPRYRGCGNIRRSDSTC